MGINILLISPAADNEALWITGTEGPEVKTNAPPLALATIAALTPEGFDVDIWDENVQGVIDAGTVFEKTYDLVGVTGYKAHFSRCRQLAGIFRKKGILIAIGGPGVSATPDEYQHFFDILFVGEAERTWPQFLNDWKRGTYKTEYRQIESIEMLESPIPSWELIGKNIAKYSLGSIQTTRGCPFDCEFCDVVYLFGRRSRHKPIDRVLEEIKLLQRLGCRSIFFCDDEFIGDPPYTKELLRAIIDLNATFKNPLTYSTQLTLRVSKDDELLELLADANFDILFIGIETPNEESLRESNKLHNLGMNIVEKVHKIQSYGISIRAGIIVGFDHDDTTIFDMQYQFIQDSFIPSIAINMLKAPFGTRLWTRLTSEGRVVKITPDIREKLRHPRSYTTIIPKQMTRVELMSGYRDLAEKVFSWSSFGARVLGYIGNLNRIPEFIGAPRIAEISETYPAKYGDSDEARQVISSILDAVDEKVPAMQQRIAALIVQHAKYRENVVSLLPQIDRQIAMEANGQIVFEKDDRTIPVPQSFRIAYREIFSNLHVTVSKALIDQKRTPEALVAVLVDFLEDYGNDFKEFNPNYNQLLSSYVDRVTEMINENSRAESLYSLGDAPECESNPAWLRDDIMKNVYQILANRSARAGQ